LTRRPIAGQDPLDIGLVVDAANYTMTRKPDIGNLGSKEGRVRDVLPTILAVRLR